MAQAYHLEHLRSLDLGEEARRHCFELDSDLGKKKKLRRCLSEARTNCFKETCLLALGSGPAVSPTEVALIFLSYPLLHHVTGIKDRVGSWFS